MVRNVLICLVDALRYDVLKEGRHEGLLNKLGVNENLNVPNIEFLEQKGLSLPNLHSPYGSTPPAVTSLLTGLYPREHGAYDYYRPMKSTLKTMPEYFSEHDFYTILSNGHDLFGVMGLRDRFDEHLQGPVNQLIERIETLNNEGKNVFVYHHSFDVHEPYCLSRYPADKEHHRTAVNLANEILESCGADKRFSLSDSLSRAEGKDFQFESDPSLPVFEFFFDTIHNSLDAEIQLFDDPVNLLAQVYVQGVNLFDRYHLSHLVRFLEESEFGRNSLLLLTSDHGQVIKSTDSESPRQTLGHQGPPEEELIRIPGLIVNSNLEEHQLDQSNLTSLVDLLPTLLSETGIEYDPENFSGIDLANSTENERFVFADFCMTQYDLAGTGEKKLETVFPLPGILSWHAVLSSEGYKYYRKGLEFTVDDLTYPFETFVRLAFAKIVFKWITEEEIEEIRKEFDDPTNEEERRKFVADLSEKSEENWQPALYNWKKDRFESNNLLISADQHYSKIASQLNEKLVERFPDPILLNETADQDFNRDDNDEIERRLRGLGYL